MKRFRPVWLAVLAVLLGAGPARAQQYADGIYAEFNTSMGSYTCVLHHAQAPKAVANFIGLATGQRPWLDLVSGTVKTNPFYNGTTFHRVIAGFMNQGGSPNGQGTDGPGYQFVDEFTNTLRHDSFGVLSMANAGPDSNGSQIFITVSPQAQLDDVHTIFGRLYGGSNVVRAINGVATGAGDKPLTNVVLQSVIIRRVGTVASNFNIHAQGLPWVTNLNLKISLPGNDVRLAFTNRLNMDNRIYSSTNLVHWFGNELGIETASPVAGSVLLNGRLGTEFFRAAQIQYPTTLFSPRNVFGRKLTLNFSSYFGTVAVTFDNFGTGSYTNSGGGSGPLVEYVWQQDPHRGRLLSFWIYPYPPMDLHLGYTNAIAGAFKGTAYYSATNRLPLSGTFSSSP